jgi:hypothetical protein
MFTIRTPIWKVAATVGGVALTGAATWLNAQHVAASEGWASPLVYAGVFVTLCAASAPPFAERATQSGQYLKAAVLWLFFGLAVAFSLSASIARSSGYVAGKAAKAESSNKAAQLAEEAYAAARRSVEAECVKRGPKCRALEEKADAARKALAEAAPVASADPGAERVAAVLGVDESSVELYAPLFLPLGLELGGFIFLATGLAPARRRREDAAEPDAKAEPATAKHARRSPAVAKLMREAASRPAKAGAVGTRAYYMARLEAEFPAFATKVRKGELSCFAASVATGLRKAPKARKWNANDYRGRLTAATISKSKPFEFGRLDFTRRLEACGQWRSKLTCSAISRRRRSRRRACTMTAPAST